MLLKIGWQKINMLPGYEILDKIHEGHKSLIYRAIRLVDNNYVILKILADERPSPEQIARFKREFEINKKLASICGVVQAYELVHEQHLWFMVLEDCGGHSLENLIYAKSIDLLSFLQISIEITDILAKIHHQHIIHRDLNPSNILINPQTQQIKFIDFGLSTVALQDLSDFNLAGLEGTFAYMSPEQTGRTNQIMDYRTDFYSLGVTLYQLITQKLPFEEVDPIALIHAHIAKNPLAPHIIKPGIPKVISQIIMKLMAKDVNERYQSAFGVNADLKLCLRQLEHNGTIEPMLLGKQDVSPMFQISQKLYGREFEIKILLEIFAQVCNGKNHLLMLAGSPGVGKTALVKTLYKPLTQQHGYFVRCRFERYQVKAYHVILRAFRDLIKQLLIENEQQLEIWRQRFNHALGNNARLITEVIPELSLIIGKPACTEHMNEIEQHNRFSLTLQRFILTFTKVKKPLVIFLDNVHWVDTASLDLLLPLMKASDNYLFIIAAYQDNNIQRIQALMHTFEALEAAKVAVRAISLLPLNINAINQLIADSLLCDTIRSQELAKLILAKTAGNPYFINELLKSLYREKLIIFNFENLIWEWDLDNIQTQTSITENVIDLLADKIQRLPDDMQQFLKLAACVGYQFNVEILEQISNQSVFSLWDAITEGLIIPIEAKNDYLASRLNDKKIIYNSVNIISSQYCFTHYRVQQAAYSLIDNNQRQQLHKQIGEVLLKIIPADKHEQYVFDLVNQFNQALILITDKPKQIYLAKLNLLAGRKARLATNYALALNYLSTGISLLGAKSWQSQYELTLCLTIEAAETAFLANDLVQMQGLAEIVLRQGHNILDKIRIYELKIQFLVAEYRHTEAINIAYQVLYRLGIRLPNKINKLNLLINLWHNYWLLYAHKIENLANLPNMTDPSKLAALRILGSMAGPAYQIKSELTPVLTCKAIGLCLYYGNAHISAYIYANYGVMLCTLMHDINNGYKFADLSLQLLDKVEQKNIELKTKFIIYAQLKIWREPLTELLPNLKQIYQETLEIADLPQAAMIICNYYMIKFVTGNNLFAISKGIKNTLEHIERIKPIPSLVYARICYQSLFYLQTNDPKQIEYVQQDAFILRGDFYDESVMLTQHLEHNDQVALFNLYFHKMFICYHFYDYSHALYHAQKAQEFINVISNSAILPSFYFYLALIYLALLPNSSAEQRILLLRDIKSIQKKLQFWAKHAPRNHSHKYLLIKAEIAAIAQNSKLATSYYEQAAQAAKAYPHEEALICEHAAKFLFLYNQPRLAQVYLNDAHYAYTQWGAKAKVLILEQKYSQFLLGNRQINKRSTSNTAYMADNLHSKHLAIDLSSVLKSVQTISGEIVLEQLLKKLMNIVVENAGAQRGVLILEKLELWFIEAEAGKDITVLQSIPINNVKAKLPISLINYVIRAKQAVVLHNALEEGSFTFDPHFIAWQVKSVLCMPLINQTKLQGILYLENNLSSHVFTPNRLEILNIFCSQMAISIENARLYANLEDKVQERTLALEMQKQELSNTLQKLQSTQQQLVESEKMAALGNLVAGVAHEINTPLGIAVTAASKLRTLSLDLQQLYHNQQMKRSDLEQYLNSALQGTDFVLNNLSHAHELIQGFKQVAVDQSTEQKRLFELCSYLDEILLSLHPKLKRTQHNVIIRCQHPIELYSYPSAFYQIISNLIMNSLIHAFNNKNSGKITLKLQLEQDILLLIYQDNGKGIAEQHIKNIFDPFFTTNRQDGGCGLGLHIVYNLVTHKLNGKIQCHSTINQGVTFTMRLPRILE